MLFGKSSISTPFVLASIPITEDGKNKTFDCTFSSADAATETRDGHVSFHQGGSMWGAYH